MRGLRGGEAETKSLGGEQSNFPPERWSADDIGGGRWGRGFQWGQEFNGGIDCILTDLRPPPRSRGFTRDFSGGGRHIRDGGGYITGRIELIKK